MSLNREKYDLIDKYLRGNLSPEEMFAFEKEIGNDPKLAEQLQLHRVADELSFEKGLVDIWEKVGEDLSQQPPSSFHYSKIIAFFFGVLLAGGLSFYFFRGKEKEVVVLSRSVNVEEKKLTDSAKINITDKNPLQEDKAERKITIHQEPKTDELYIQPDSSAEQKEKVDIHQKKDFINPPIPNNAESPVIPDKSCPEITFKVHSQPSCRNEENGSIQIQVSAIKGGEKPYSYSIDGNDFTLQSFNSHLAKGIYLVKVKDHNGCYSQKEVEVHEKPCAEVKDYTFNPGLGNWKLPFQGGESGTITITDQVGKIVFSSKIYSGVPEEWDGRSSTGEPVEMGTYLYIAETDNKEIRQGYITIIY